MYIFKITIDIPCLFTLLLPVAFSKFWIIIYLDLKNISLMLMENVNLINYYLGKESNKYILRCCILYSALLYVIDYMVSIT